MWWMVAAAAKGWLGNQSAKAQAEIDTKMSKVNTELSGKTTRAKNVETMARNNLSRYLQSVNNNRVLDDGGDAFTANLVNGLKGADQRANQRVLEDIGALEQFGAASAAQAQSGTGGQVVDMINSTTALRSSISRELERQSGESANFEVGQRSRSIMSQMVGGLDGSLIIDSLDTNQAYEQSYSSSNRSAISSSLIEMLPALAGSFGGGAGAAASSGAKFGFNAAQFGSSAGYQPTAGNQFQFNSGVKFGR